VLLQEPMNIFRQLAPNAFRRRDLFHCRFAQPIHRTKFSQEQSFAVLTYSGAIVQNAFVDPLLEQQLMISIGEAMRFIADSLKQM
jgi:hypothetical protein